MNVVDVLVLTLLAAADLCLIVHLRRRRARRMRLDRMARSLQLHIQRVLEPDAVVAVGRRQFDRRAS